MMNEFDEHAEERFGSLDRVYGSEPMAHLQNAHICVVGVGGVGSWIVDIRLIWNRSKLMKARMIFIRLFWAMI